MSDVLASLGLRLAPGKTQVVHIDEGFTFLGFDIRRMRKRGTSKYHFYTTPSKKAIASIKVAVQPWWRDYAAVVMSGVRAGGSHAPVVNSWVIASRVSRPHLVAVDR